jgi:transcriptional regulator with XRE-family HTH domain
VSAADSTADRLRYAARQLPRIRAEQGLSQRVVAASLGRSQQWLDHIEKGRSLVALDLVPDLARALDVPVTDLLPDASES